MFCLLRFAISHPIRLELYFPVCCFFIFQDVQEYLKDSIPKIVSNHQSDLFPIYRTDIMEFIQTHSTSWDDAQMQSLIQELLNDGDSCLSLLYAKDTVSSSSSPKPFSIKILLDIGSIVCVNEETLSNVISRLFSASPAILRV